MIPIGRRNSSRSISPGWVGTRCVGTRTIVSPLRCHLAVIHNLHCARSRLCPHKTDAVPVIDSDAVLAQSCTSQSFQPITRRHTQLNKGHHRIKLIKLSSGGSPKRSGKSSASSPGGRACLTSAGISTAGDSVEAALGQAVDLGEQLGHMHCSSPGQPGTPGPTSILPAPFPPPIKCPGLATHSLTSLS